LAICGSRPILSRAANESGEVVTRDELLKNLRALLDDNDKYNGPEEWHKAADQYLLDFIDDDDVYRAFYDIPKWYY
jgi:hypothetical protein